MGDPGVARSHDFDPDDYLDSCDVAGRLGDGWTIELDEIRERASAPSDRSPHSKDVVLRARRNE